MIGLDRWSLIEKAVMSAVHSVAADDMKKAVVRETKQQIDKEVYSFKANEYERTYELRESVTGEVNIIPSGVELEVYHDTSKIIPRTEGFWTQHSSLVDHSSQNDLLPLWIVEGTENSPYYNHSPRDYISSTKRSLRIGQRHLVALREGLRRRGINTI